jgi:hypothetical protein
MMNRAGSGSQMAQLALTPDLPQPHSFGGMDVTVKHGADVFIINDNRGSSTAYTATQAPWWFLTTNACFTTHICRESEPD